MFARQLYTVALPGQRFLSLGGRTLVMGILNVTPDSFADGGLWIDPSRAVDAALQMEADGADLIDIGGESTRPGAEPLPVDEELSRVLPVIEAAASRLRVPISVDTYKADVARRALAAGAALVNDVSALRYDSELAAVVAESGAALVLMHNRGRSRQMYQEAHYGSVVDEVAGRAGRASGVGRRRRHRPRPRDCRPRHRVCQAGRAQPGVAGAPSGTGRSRSTAAGRASRKSFLKAGLGERLPGDREWGTAAAVAASVMGGAHIVRVHAVKEMVDVVRTIDAIRDAGRAT